MSASLSKSDIEKIVAGVADSRPTSQFPGGMGGMVAAVSFLFMAGGAALSIIAAVVLGIFGFVASHFFGQFTDLSANFNRLSVDFRQLQTEVQRANESFLELKNETKDRHTSADDVAAQKVDLAAREALRTELLREVNDVRKLGEANAEMLEKRSKFMDETEENFRTLERRIFQLESK